MKVLLDNCVPRTLRRQLGSHDVRTAFEMGWADLRNGLLLREAGRLFDVMVTVDKNIPHQHDLSNLPVAVVVLAAPRISAKALKPLGPAVVQALAEIRPRQMLRVSPGGIEIVTAENA